MLHADHFRRSRIRILLADDHSQVRRQLVARLSRETEFDVVGVTLNSIQTLQEVLSKEPELLLVDPIMRDGLGLATLRQLRTTVPGMSVVVLTAVVDTTLKMQLDEMGIKHILAKGVLSSRLLSELRAASQFDRTNSYFQDFRLK